MRGWSGTVPSGPIVSSTEQPFSVIHTGGRAAPYRSRSDTSSSVNAAGTTGQPNAVTG